MRKNVLKVLSTTSMLALVIGISSCASVGLTGPTGPQGEVGAQGIQGSSGVSGAPGLQGPTGPAGPQGTTGPQGLRGFSGSPGVAGTSGKDGTSTNNTILNPLRINTYEPIVNQTTYVNSLIDEGYIAIDSIIDYLAFSLSPLSNAEYLDSIIIDNVSLLGDFVNNHWYNDTTSIGQEDFYDRFVLTADLDFTIFHDNSGFNINIFSAWYLDQLLTLKSDDFIDLDYEDFSGYDPKYWTLFNVPIQARTEAIILTPLQLSLKAKIGNFIDATTFHDNSGVPLTLNQDDLYIDNSGVNRGVYVFDIENNGILQLTPSFDTFQFMIGYNFNKKTLNSPESTFNGIFDGANYEIKGFEMIYPTVGIDYLNLSLFFNPLEIEVRNLSLNQLNITSKFRAAAIAAKLDETDYLKIYNVILRDSIIQAVNTVGVEVVGGFLGLAAVELIYIQNSSIIDTLISGQLNLSGGFIGEVTGNIITIIEDSNISGSSIIGSDNVGGFIGYNGSYQNLLITNSNIYLELEDVVSGNDRVGGLVGYTANGYILIQNSNVLGEGSIISTIDNVGGLVGYIDGARVVNISNSHNQVAILGQDKTGGLIGYIKSSLINIKHSNNTGDVTGYENVGGLIGQLDSVISLSIESSYNSNNIYGIESVGGLIGQFNLNQDMLTNPKRNIVINNTYVLSNIDINSDVTIDLLESNEISVEYAGGMIGYLNVVDTAEFTTFKVSNSYFYSEISSLEFVGGLIGYASIYTNSDDNSDDFSPNLMIDLSKILILYYSDILSNPLIGGYGDYDSGEIVFNIDDVFYYYNEEIEQIIIEYDFYYGAVALYEQNYFVETDFIFKDIWNFSSTWEFATESILPTLKLNPQSVINIG
jgi:hypothetical protein